jgi:hypothetical protein
VRTVITRASAVASMAALVAFAAGAQAKPSCSAAHSKTLAANAFARVYGSYGKVYVCARPTGKTTLLKGAREKCQTGPNVYICDRFALGGRWVAWTVRNPSDVDVIGGKLTVMYIPTRSVNHRWYPTGRLDGEIYKVVVLRDGAAAWTESEPDGEGGAFAVGVFGTDRRSHPIDRLDTCGASISSQASCYIGGNSLHGVRGGLVAWKYSLDGSQKPTITATAKLY